jgi:hypothetical protein
MGFLPVHMRETGVSLIPNLEAEAMGRVTCVGWCLMLFLVMAPLAADEVYLSDGRILEGEIISPPDAPVLDLRSGDGNMVAIQHVDRSKVLRIVYGQTPRQQELAELRARRQELGEGGEAEDWWRLARRAKALEETVLFKELAFACVARDRDHAEARKALGMVRYNGVWMRPNEVIVARGAVLFRGQWMTWAEREALVNSEARRREELLAARKAREEARRAAAASATFSDLYPETIMDPYRSGAGNYRSIYWPGLGGQGLNSGMTSGYTAPYQPTVSIQANGGGANHHWSFSWNF